MNRVRDILSDCLCIVCLLCLYGIRSPLEVRNRVKSWLKKTQKRCVITHKPKGHVPFAYQRVLARPEVGSPTLGSARGPSRTPARPAREPGRYIEYHQSTNRMLDATTPAAAAPAAATQRGKEEKGKRNDGTRMGATEDTIAKEKAYQRRIFELRNPEVAEIPSEKKATSMYERAEVSSCKCL